MHIIDNGTALVTLQAYGSTMFEYLCMRNDMNIYVRQTTLLFCFSPLPAVANVDCDFAA